MMQCLLDTLPSRNWLYTSKVLDLLSISTRWQAFVLSAPILWKEIHIDKTIADFLVTVSVFAACSGTVPLDIIVWEEPGSEWLEVCRILLVHKERIQSFRYLGPSLYDQSRELQGSRYIEIVSIISKYLGGLPNLRELDFGRGIILHPDHMKSLQLVPNARITTPVNSSELLQISNKTDLRRITRLEASCHIDDLAPILDEFSALSDLYLGRVRAEIETHQLETHSKTPVLTGVPLSLKSIAYRQPYSENLRRLLKLTSFQLSSLEVQIPMPKLQETIEILKSLVNLQSLVLEVDDWEVKVPPFLALYNGSVGSLKTLGFGSSFWVVNIAEYDSRPITQLFEEFTILYPHVKHVNFNGVKDILNVAHHYLQRLESLESISIDKRMTKITSILQLSTLQSLSTMDPDVLPYLNVPNLLSLHVEEVTSSSQMTEHHIPNLHKLVIRPDHSKQLTLTLDPSKYSKLRDIEIKLDWYRNEWQLTSLPQLVSITLDNLGFLGPHANRLCVSLIYNPEICPSLREIHFSDFVEWDFLFLMLRRRNCEAKNVTRIRTIHLEFVPVAFQAALAGLLEGNSEVIPPMEDLLMEATRELIFDPSMYVCLSTTASTDILLVLDAFGV